MHRQAAGNGILEMLMTRSRITALSLAAFVLGLLVCAAILHAFTPHPLDLHADIRSEKLVVMREWQGSATAAAFGSSHVHNGFDPRVFDSELAESGIRERSINLGIAGGAQTEQREVALQFVRHLQPSAQPLVLLELNAGANLTNDHLVHPRSINLYDTETLRFAWTLVSPEMNMQRRWGRRGYALAAWVLHGVNLGMISSRIFSAPVNTEQLDDETDHDRRGLLAGPRPATRDAEMQQAIARYDHTHETTQGEIDQGNHTLPVELIRASAVPNLEVAYLVTPKLSDLTSRAVWPPCIQTLDGPVPILPADQPERYAALYHDPSNWQDETHVTEKGAALITKAWADLWIAWIRQGRQTAIDTGCGV